MMEEEVKATETVIQNASNAVVAVTEGVAEQTKSMLHIDDLAQFVTWGNLIKIVTSIIAILIFYGVYRLIKKVVLSRTKEKVTAHTQMILNKVVSYVFYVVISMYILSLFGINLKAIWGAAGVAGLAIGFAAQTSVSNIISGLFVLSEKSMKIGDFISVGDVSGVVDSISLLSVRIHTLDNQMIRIPNSTIINSNLYNYNHFNLRRFVFDMPISYSSDMEKALATAEKIPSLCPSVLQDPAPKAYFDGFGDAINLKIAVWFNSSDLVAVKNEMYKAIVNQCRADNIEIPFTHYDVTILNNK